MKTLSALALVSMLALPIGAASATSKTLADAAKEAGMFTTLLKGAEAAGLIDKLKGDGPYTLFAPTDAAFAKLDPDIVEHLLKPENREELAALLKHHIVPGKVLAIDARNAKGPKILKNARGTELTVTGGPTGFAVGDVAIVASEITASNGVIHAIDTVIDPEL
jgi:uncharacterized surface protein with fasciclin (FAS1) repeats